MPRWLCFLHLPVLLATAIWNNPVGHVLALPFSSIHPSTHARTHTFSIAYIPVDILRSLPLDLNFYCRLDKERAPHCSVHGDFHWGPIHLCFISLNPRLVNMTLVGSKFIYWGKEGKKGGFVNSLLSPSSLNSRFTVNIFFLFGFVAVYDFLIFNSLYF